MNLSAARISGPWDGLCAPTKRAARVLVPALAATLLASAARAQLPAVHFENSATEIVGRADLDGDGRDDVILADRASGAFRVAYQTGSGVFTWDEPKASGATDLTGLSAGRLLVTTRDTLAATAPGLNRVQLLSPTLGGPAVPTPYYQTTIGPNLLATANFAGTIAVDDLLVGTQSNSGPNVASFDLFTNNPAGTFAFTLNRATAPLPFRDANRVVMKTTLAGTVAFLEQKPSDSVLRIVSCGEAGQPVRLTVPLSKKARVVVAPFAGATYAHLIVWEPGSTAIQALLVSEPVANTYAVGAPVALTAPFPLGQVVLVVHSGGEKLVLVSEDGTTASVHGFDGATLSAAVQTITPAAGESLTSAVALPNIRGFHLLSGATGSGHSGRSRSFAWGGSNFTETGNQKFNPMGEFAGAGNVLVFAGEPFVNANATVISSLRARDWSSGTPPVPPAALNVTGEAFASPTVGLGTPAPVALGAAPAGATHVLLNQYRSDLSVAATGAAAGEKVGWVKIDPNGGTFSKSVLLSFTASAGMSVFFRDAGGAWTPYAAPGAQPPGPPQSGPPDPVYDAWWAKFVKLVRFADTTIEYYGQVGAKRTAIKTATYKFTAPPATLSSLHDGVPDFVKLGLKYNPFEIPIDLRASETGNFLPRVLPAALVPDRRRLSPTSINVFVRPLSHDGAASTATPSLLANVALPDGTPNPGNQIFAYDLGGTLLAQGDDPDTSPSSNTNEGLAIYNPPFAEPSARLSLLGGDGNGGLWLATTKPGFALNTAFPPAPQSPFLGRELVAARALPRFTPAQYTGTFGGGALATEAANWIAGAQTFYNASPVPTLPVTIDSLDTMATLVLERWLELKLIERAALPVSFTPVAPDASAPPAPNANYLTLTRYRANESALAIGPAPVGTVYPRTQDLRLLATYSPTRPAYRVSVAVDTIQMLLRTSPDADIANLRAITLDVYRLSAAHGNEFPGAFAPPVEALRQFMHTGMVAPGYGNDPWTGPTPPAGAPFGTLPDAAYTSAMVGVQKILAAIPARPVATLQLVVRNDTATSACTRLDRDLIGGQVSLIDSAGAPFKFPDAFDIVPGAKIEVTGFTDVPASPCGGDSLEVVLYAGAPVVQVTSIPSSTGLDSDGNLLPDAWELFFFGELGNDPFADLGGDGYTTLQKYLDGNDPINPTAYSGTVAVNLALPAVQIAPFAGGQLKVSFNFPMVYANLVNFGLQTTNGLGGGWGTAPEVFAQTTPGHFEVVLPTGADAKRFWRVTLQLK